MKQNKKHLEKQKLYYQNNKESRLKYAFLYRQKNREIIRKKDVEFYKNNREKKMWNVAKKRAKDKNMDFNIEITDIKIPEFCPILGLKLCISNKKKQHNSPSLDRIDNLKGYVKGNIRVISDRANTLKSDASSDELYSIFIDSLNCRLNSSPEQFYDKVEEVQEPIEESA